MLIYSTLCFGYVSCSIGTCLSVPVLIYMYICDLKQTLDTLPQLTPPIKAPRRQLVASWCHTPPPNPSRGKERRGRRRGQRSPTVTQRPPTVAARAPSGAPPACRACEVRDGRAGPGGVGSAGPPLTPQPRSDKAEAA